MAGQSFEQALERCLADVPPGDLAAGRARFLAVAARERARRPRAAQRPAARARRTFARRFAVGFLAALTVLMLLGEGSVFAASSSLPGEFFYPVKLTFEEAQLVLAGTPAEQAALALEFAEERTMEARTLVLAGSPLPTGFAARLDRYFAYALNRAAQAPEAEMNGLLERVVFEAQLQWQLLERTRSAAPPEVRDELGRAQLACLRWRAAALAGLGNPTSFRLEHHGAPPAPDDGRSRRIERIS